MKTIIRRNPNAKFGYEYVTINEDGIENVVELTKKTTDNYLHLPENAFNRKLIGIAFLDKQGDEWEVTTREAKAKVTNPATPRKGLEEYLEGDDKITYLNLVEKAMANREKVKNDPVAKLRAQIEKLKAQLAAATSEA